MGVEFREQPLVVTLCASKFCDLGFSPLPTFAAMAEKLMIVK